jgi:hypothetical protein
MRELLSLIQTSRPSCRIALFRSEDGYIQFVRQYLSDKNRDHPDQWQDIDESGLYDDAAAAQVDMVAYAKEYESA